MDRLERYLQSARTYLPKSRQEGRTFLLYWQLTKIVLTVVSFSLAVAALAMLVETNLILQELGAALILVGTVLPALAWVNINFIV